MKSQLTTCNTSIRINYKRLIIKGNFQFVRPMPLEEFNFRRNPCQEMIWHRK